MCRLPVWWLRILIAWELGSCHFCFGEKCQVLFLCGIKVVWKIVFKGKTACFMCRSLFVRLWSAPCECVFEKSKVNGSMGRNDQSFDSCSKVGTRVPYVTPALASVYINLPWHPTFLPSNLLKKCTTFFSAQNYPEDVRCLLFLLSLLKFFANLFHV
jgi:hypothetical protein